VKENMRKKMLRKLLLRGKGRSRLWAALLSLCIGTTLLLLSVMIWWNFQELLHGKSDDDSLGSTFLTVSKRVTEQNMGKPGQTVFSPLEIDSLRKAPQVQDVGLLSSNHFPVYATLNTRLAFSTDMFLEAVPDRFIDQKPADWAWQPGSNQVPIIISSEFLNLYNYGFALSQGLPQLSEASIKSIAFNLKVGSGDMQAMYTGHVVGFSDRISSVLVPQSFIDYGNKVYGRGAVSVPSRLIVKAKDPSDKSFVQYLQQRDYTTNAEQLRWSKLRAIVEVVSGATGVLAILLMGIGTLVFILFIELTIARAQHSITLLLQIGYGPRYLSRFMIKRFLPLVLVTAIISMVLAAIAQAVSSVAIKDMNLQLSFFPGWPVWVALLVSTLILFALVGNSISRAIKNHN
jgi:hypothetical protein